MLTDQEEAALAVRIEECRVKQLVAEARLRVEVLRFQQEIECFLLQARVWAQTHRGDPEVTG